MGVNDTSHNEKGLKCQTDTRSRTADATSLLLSNLDDPNQRKTKQGSQFQIIGNLRSV
jgi:hypothetical protein